MLRGKYRDYCSACVADALLSLSPDQIYTLSRSESGAVDRLGSASYNDAIRLAEEKIRDKLKLPDFQTWVEQYKKDPDRFDPHLIGLWESEEPATLPGRPKEKEEEGRRPG